MHGIHPAKEPFGILGPHIHASAAHWRAKVIMPVRTMESYPRFGEETSLWNTGQFVVIQIRKQVSIPHMLGWIFLKDANLAAWCFG